MLRKIKIAIIGLFITSSLVAGDVSQKEFKSIETMPIFLGSGMKVIKAYDDGEFYLIRANIQGNIQELVLSKDKKYLIAGKVYNTITGEALSIPNDVSVLNGKEALTYGKGNDLYYLFTDPECPYCKKFESYFDQIKNDVTIKVFFYPLSFHKNAKEMSLYILSQKTNEDKIKAMFNVSLDSDDYKNRDIKNKEQLTKILDENIKLGEELGVRGTPALFSKDGKSASWVNVLKTYGIDVK